LRPVIRNIKLSGEKWFGLDKSFKELRIYDIIEIDFRMPGDEKEKYPRHLIRMIEEAGEEKIVSAESVTDEYVTLYNNDFIPFRIVVADNLPGLLCRLRVTALTNASGRFSLFVNFI